MCCDSLYLEAGRQLVGVGSPSTPMWVTGIKLTQVFSLGSKYLDTQPSSLSHGILKCAWLLHPVHPLCLSSCFHVNV